MGESRRRTFQSKATRAGSANPGVRVCRRDAAEGRAAQFRRQGGGRHPQRQRRGCLRLTTTSTMPARLWPAVAGRGFSRFQCGSRGLSAAAAPDRHPPAPKSCGRPAAYQAPVVSDKPRGARRPIQGQLGPISYFPVLNKLFVFCLFERVGPELMIGGREPARGLVSSRSTGRRRLRAAGRSPTMLPVGVGVFASDSGDAQRFSSLNRELGGDCGTSGR